jgi:abhydrolase domain-containing protein 6
VVAASGNQHPHRHHRGRRVTTIVYLPGIAGDAGMSPALQQLADGGAQLVLPAIPGFDGRTGFTAPVDYLDWLHVFAEAIESSGALAGGPIDLVGASVGGMIAAELAALRPEIVNRLALLAPFGINDASNPGFDLYGVRTPERLPHLFAKGVPEAVTTRFAHFGEEEAPVAAYLADIAAASLIWPLGDHDLGKRLHRIKCPRLVLWGGQDELLPPALIEAWGGGTVIDGAGHLMEWDTPDEVAAALRSFLA